MIDMPRLYIKDSSDNLVSVLDGNYYDSCMKLFLTGKSLTFEFKVAKTTKNDYENVKVGGKIAFTYKNTDYWLNIINVYQDETVMEVSAWSLSLEMTNEFRAPYKSPRAMSFQEYYNTFKSEDAFELGINEVSDKKISHEWEGQDTLLGRMLSLANVFDAEIEWITINDKFNNLDKIVMNVYRKHSEKYQGIGMDRRAEIFRYGKDVSTVKKTEDITELYTGIRAKGKDGLGLTGYDKKEYNDDGVLEYFVGGADIRAPLARDRFPSTTNDTDDNYIIFHWDTEYATKEALYGNALAKLKEISVPKLTWEVEGYIDAMIGDTVTIEDDGYKPTLYLEARVAEQEIWFDDPSKNKTVFTNVVEVQSEVSQDLLSKMKEMIEANKKYDYQIETTDGIIFKNGKGSTQLTAKVMDGIVDLAGSFTIKWTKDGVFLAEGKTITVKATDVNEKAVYRFEAIDGNGDVRGSYEATVTNVNDGKEGEQGEQGEKGEDGKTSYVHQAWANGLGGSDGKNLLSGVALTKDKYIDKNGTILNHDGWNVVDYIEVSNYGYLTIGTGMSNSGGNESDGGAGMCMYDKDKNFMYGISNRAVYLYRKVYLFPGVHYVRFSLAGVDIPNTNMIGTTRDFTPSVPELNIIPNSSLLENHDGWNAGLCTATTFYGAGTMMYRDQDTDPAKGRSFFFRDLPAGYYAFKPGDTFTLTCEVMIPSQSAYAYSGNGPDTSVFLRAFNANNGVLQVIDINIHKITRNLWTTVTGTGTVQSTADPSKGLQVTLAISAQCKGAVFIRRVKLSKAGSPDVWVPNRFDDNYSDYMPMRYTGWITNFEEEAPQDPSEYVWQKVLGPQGPPGEPGKNGENGKDGEDAPDVISGYLSNEIIGLPADYQGVVSDFSKATGEFVMYEGQEKLESGVTYSVFNQNGITVTIDSKTGAYKVTAASADNGTAFLRAVYQGVTVEKVLSVAKSKSGKEGQPTGITVSATIPASPYVGMLWQCSGNVAGYINGVLYRWTGAKWEVHTFKAENIIATSLSAISANLGTITAGRLTGTEIIGSKIVNTFDTTINGARVTGTTSMEKAELLIQYNLPATSQSGRVSIHPLAISGTIYKPNGQIQSGYELMDGSLSLNDGTYSGNLTAQMLYDTKWVQCQIRNGTGVIWARRYLNRMVIRFDGYILNASGKPVCELPDSVNPKTTQMINVQCWTTKPALDTFQLNEDGTLWKLSNTSGGLPFRTSVEVYSAAF